MSSTKVGLEDCGNCGRTIGRLEVGEIHGSNIVCSDCHRRLASESSTTAAPPASHLPPPLRDARAKNVQTVEVTAKRWKLSQMCGVLGILLGFTVLMIGSVGESPAISLGGVLLIAASVPVYGVGRFCGWWFHG